MKKTCEVVFMVKAETKFFESVKVVGSEAQLGCWMPNQGHLVSTSDLVYPYWYSVERVRLPIGKLIEFKLVMILPDESIRWESTANRVVQLSQDAVICCTWQQDGLKVDLNGLGLQQLEVPRKASELVKQGSDSSLQGYFRMYNEHQRTDSILAVLSHATYFIDKSKIRLIQPQQYEQTVQNCINLESYIFVTDHKCSIPANNLCLINYNIELQAVKDVKSFKAIIFSRLNQLKSHLKKVQPLGSRILSCFNNRVCINNDSIQFIILSKFEPEYKENHRKLSHLLARWTFLIKQSQNAIKHTIYFNKVPPLENSVIVINHPKIQQLSAINKLKQPHNLIILVINDIQHIEMYLKHIDDKINIIADHGKVTKINGILEKRHNGAQQRLSAVRETIRKLGFGSFFQVHQVKQAYLCLTCESTRLSSSILNFISNEIRKNPLYNGIRVRRQKNRMFIYCHMEVIVMEEQMKIYEYDNVWIVGQPSYPQIFQQQQKIGYVSSQKMILD